MHSGAHNDVDKRKRVGALAGSSTQRINYLLLFLSRTRTSLSILMHDVIDSPMARREKTVTAGAADFLRASRTGVLTLGPFW